MNGEEALGKLLEGNKRFVSGSIENKDFSAKREELKTGQHPYAVVVSCSDSRVVPEFIFDVGLGEIFTSVEAGNVADKVGLGSIEYGVEHLHAPLLVVMGHEKCGAVTVAYDGGEVGGNIATIIKKIAPAAKRAKKGGEKATEVEKAIVFNVKKSIKNILAKSPILKKAAEEGHLKVVGMKYFFDGHVEVVC